MIRVAVDRRWRVRLVVELDLPIDASTAWLSVSDFRRYACLDIFHRRLELNGQPRAGATFTLEHGLLGLRLTRAGRVLHWHEGRSYAFSDLSRRDSRKGFPHVYIYTLTPLETGRCSFRLEVRGRWTARFLGRPLVRLWLGWILLKTATSIHNELLGDALRRSKENRPEDRECGAGAWPLADAPEADSMVSTPRLRF
jgi:hypothetical protein